jgi:hypothetical protein
MEAVLQDRNNLPSNPADCTIHIQDSHDTKVQIIIIQYDQYCWNMSADFKVTAPLLDMQLEHVYVAHAKRTDTQDQSLCCNHVASQYAVYAEAE